MVRARHDFVRVIEEFETVFGCPTTTELDWDDVGSPSSIRQPMDPSQWPVCQFLLLDVHKFVFQIALAIVALYDETSSASAHCFLVLVLVCCNGNGVVNW